MKLHGLIGGKPHPELHKRTVAGAQILHQDFAVFIPHGAVLSADTRRIGVNQVALRGISANDEVSRLRIIVRLPDRAPPVHCRR